MHVLRGVHGDPVGGGHGAEGRPPFTEWARDTLGPPAAPATARGSSRLRVPGGEHAERGFPDGAETQHVAAEPRGHGHGGGNDRATGTGEVAAAVDPGRVDAERLFDGAGAALAHASAAHARIGRQPVDVPDRQSGVGDRLQAGVDRQRQGVDHQPSAEGGATDAAEDGFVFEAVVAEGGAGERPHRFGHPVDGVHRTRRLEQGQPHVLLLQEPDRDLLADLDLGRLAPDDVRRQVDARVLGQCHVGDHVGRIEVREPAVGVDGEAHDGAAARHRGSLRRPAPAVGADGDRRMDELAAVAALLHAERAVCAGGPEPLAGGVQLRQRSHGCSRLGRRSQY